MGNTIDETMFDSARGRIGAVDPFTSDEDNAYPIDLKFSE